MTNLYQRAKTFNPRDPGNYYAEPYTLIGHDSADVSAWLAAHPDYRASIEYERWDFEGSIDVSDIFLGDHADEDEVTAIERAA